MTDHSFVPAEVSTAHSNLCSQEQAGAVFPSLLARDKFKTRPSLLAFSEQAGIFCWWANRCLFHSGLVSADAPSVMGQAHRAAEKGGWAARATASSGEQTTCYQ